MKILSLLKNETARMLLIGFAVGSAGLMPAQPGTAQVDPHHIAQAR